MTNCTDIRGPIGRFTAALLLASSLAACGTQTLRRPAAPVGAAAATPAVVQGAATPDPSKGDPDTRFQQALALMKARQFSQAQQAFLALSQDYPRFSGPLTDLGILYAQGRQRELAVASLARAVSANPHNEVAHNWLGTLYRETGDPLRAEQSYRNAIQARPDYAQAHLNLAILYDVVLHRPREALASYRAYQRLAGSEDLIVAAWIRDLESRLETPPDATKVAGLQP